MSIVSYFLGVSVLPKPRGKVSRRVVQYEPGPSDMYPGPAQTIQITKKEMPGPKMFTMTVPIRTLQAGTPDFVEQAFVRKVKPIDTPKIRTIVLPDTNVEISTTFPEYFYNDGIRPSRRAITINDVALPSVNMYRP